VFYQQRDKKYIFHFLLAVSLNVVSEIQNVVKATKMKCPEEKMHSLQSKSNTGYDQLLKISTVFNSKSPIDQCIEHFTPTDILKTKDDPIASCDGEGQFSKYKNILTDKRHKFLFKNLMHHIVARDTVDGIATRYRLDDLGVESW
jgi:hypothetical protein